MTLTKQFTSTGHKFFVHQEAMAALRDRRGMPVVSHIMLTDICQHTCAFCSVATREGNSLTMKQIDEYLSQLVPLGLKAVILSGGGNPILYKDKESGADFNDAVDLIKDYGLEIGLITNGMPMREYAPPPIPPTYALPSEEAKFPRGMGMTTPRTSWKSVHPTTLDKLTWIRISMSGLDHKENEVYVPDIDKSKTTLGFSYVYHDIYEDPAEPNHGKVSTIPDQITKDRSGLLTSMGADRWAQLTKQIGDIVQIHEPVYVRLLPNCLEPEKIKDRCVELQMMADEINSNRPEVAFVQYKPPAPPNKCFLGYIHPVLNTDGYVYPCDSCVLNSAAGHKFAEPWRVCRWDEISKLYSLPVGSLVDPKKLCPGCVFTASNQLLEQVVNGMETPVPTESFTHPSFV